LRALAATMKFDRKKFSDEKLLEIYKALIKPRLIEEKMLILLRQNKISKWFSGIGQEAIPVGATLALNDDEYILPMHRNLGVFTTREIPLTRLFAQFKGKLSGFTKGRDRSFHFGSKVYHIVGMISHLGPQLGVADGIALASVLNNEHKATLVFSGDGGSSQGDFHEALNVAAVWNLPVIFMIESNGYGLSTPNSQQFKFKSFTDKGPGYGIEAISIDGNNILEVYTAVDKIARQIRKNPKPAIIEARTFRMRGHEEASGTKYIPKKLMDEWAKKDPVDNYEEYLLQEGILTTETIKVLKAAYKLEIEQGIEFAGNEDLPVANTNSEITDVYAPYNPTPIIPQGKSLSNKRLVDAVADGLRQSLQKFPQLIFMGQDVAEYGGVFKVSEGFLEEFGPERIRNTPLCESAILGMGLGLSVKGLKSVIEMQFADFITSGFNQVVNNLAKVHYRWGQNADVVIRMPTGGGVAAGPFHSQSNEAWFFHTPGLKIFYPSNPYDAKGLLAAAIEDPNPVLFFEHKALYRSIAQEIPDEYYTLEPGKGKIIKEGEDITIITYGMGVAWAKKAADELKEIDMEIIDLRTLIPWDTDIVKRSVSKTGKLMVLHEDTLTGGIGAEISAWVSEHCFTLLDAPVVRVASLDTPVPFIQPLENNFLANSRLIEKITELADF
jgi:2-oxoisovalerate dehydrogenase E1 component